MDVRGRIRFPAGCLADHCSGLRLQLASPQVWFSDLDSELITSDAKGSVHDSFTAEDVLECSATPSTTLVAGGHGQIWVKPRK